MSRYWVLGEGHELVATDDVVAWGKMLESSDRIVAKTHVDDAEVSTVFLGLDHSFGGSVPLLFETMVFGGPLDQECERYATWVEAEAGHASMVARCKDAGAAIEQPDDRPLDSRARLLKKLEECRQSGDREIAHCEADDALLEFINDDEVTEAFGRIEKWYA